MIEPVSCHEEGSWNALFLATLLRFQAMMDQAGSPMELRCGKHKLKAWKQVDLAESNE